MKKWITLLTLILVCTLSPSLVVQANMAPIIEGDYPGSHQVMPLDDHDIHVESELLVFDFNHTLEDQRVLNDFFSPVVKVDATYNLHNDGDSQNIKMGFPFVGAMNSEMLDNISIKLNNNQITHKIYYGNLDNYRYDFTYMDMETIFENTSEIDHAYYENNTGYLYTFTKTRSTLQIDFEDGTPLNVFHNGLYYTYNSEFIWKAHDETLEDTQFHMFLLEEGVFTCDGGTYSLQEMSYEEYINQYLNPVSFYTEEQVYIGFKDMIDLSNRFHHVSDVYYYVEEPRLMMFEFEGEILSGQNTMEVSYYFPGSVFTRYEPELYEYTYFLSPASNWKSFKDLTIQIKLGDIYPYLIEDRNEMVLLEDGTYERVYTTLPEGEFVFKVSSSENPRIPTHPLVYIGIALLLFGLGFVIIIIIVFIALLKRATKKVVKIEQPNNITKLW